MSFAALFDLTGHGPFILASYGISLVVLLWNVVVPVIKGRRLRQQIRTKIRARESAT